MTSADNEEIVSAVGVQEGNLPLCVDLDGTLLKTDLLHEMFIKLLMQNPLGGVGAVLALRNGIPAFKKSVADQVSFDPSLLPYREEVLDYLSAEKERGRPVVLITASHQAFANKVAEYLGFFDEVFATDDSENMKGEAKASLLKEKFSEFEYIGDSAADIPIWKAAKKVGLVDSSASLRKTVLEFQPDAQIFSSPSSLGTLSKMLRIHQWVKNLLLFVPIVMAHQVADIELLSTVCLGFLVFSLTASSVYLVNDLVDLENDRAHPTKKHRPLASGAVLPKTAFMWIVVLLLLVGAMLTLLPSNFALTLLLYYVLTSAYSFSLKKIAIFDIVTLASLYTIRIIAGGAAAGVPVSEWLLAFSLFMFFSLACVKRFSELLILQERGDSQVLGRGYNTEDIEQIAIFGSVSGYMSVLVLALYINSPAVVELYGTPRALWLLCVTVLYWVTRVWLLARRGEVHEDPIVFALRDRVSYLVLGVAAIIVFLAV